MKAISTKLFIVLMFVTGLLQWDVINIQWQYLTTISIIHAFSSIVLSLFFVIPFINRHVYKLLVYKKKNSVNGWIFTFVFLLVSLSGFYLFFIGNRGGDIIGTICFNIHLYGSFGLMLFFIYHIRAMFIPTPTVAAILLSIVIYPTSSYSDIGKLTSLKLEKNVKEYHNEDWTSSVKCKSCHNEIFNQWADSNHKNMVESNPYYMVMEGIAAETEGEDFRKWCMGCHNPSGLTTGLSKTSHPMTNGNFLANTLFEKGAKTLIKDFKTHGNSRLEEGVSCLTCHRITEANSNGNASYSLDLTNQKKYPFENSDAGIEKYLAEKFINAKPAVHKQSYSKPLYKESKYCASCHDETSPTTNKKIVATFQEWKESPYNNPKDKSKNKTCIDCHMTNLENGKLTPLRGTSTLGGKIKKDIKVHYFAGSNHFLAGLKNKKNEEQILQLLRTSAQIDVDIKGGQIHVGVKNVGAGHHLPTGVADFRELWLDITIKDASDKIVFSSGKLKEDGNLSPDARPFMKVFGDENGKPVGLLFWKYKTLISDTRIPAKKRRVESHDIKGFKELVYPLKATVKLNFRIYPQWVTDAVKKAYPLLPNPGVVELEKIEKEFIKK